MTKLNLPNLSYRSLVEKLVPGKETKLAYGTTAELGSDGLVRIAHHDSVIAEIGPSTLYLDNHGYETRTTIHRLDRVLADNGQPYRLSINKGRAVLRDKDTLHISHRGVRSVSITTVPHSVSVETLAY